MLFWKTVGPILACLIIATTAHGAPMKSKGTKPPKSIATMTLTDSSSSSYFSGNDTNQIDAAFEMFGQSGWTLSDKNDEVFTGTPITFASGVTNGSKSGSWAVNSWGGFTTGNVVITLKAGKGFSAFLVDTSSLDGFWTSSKGLSHASIYTLNAGPGNAAPLIPTPLPAGMVLLLTGLAGFGVARYRAKK